MHYWGDDWFVENGSDLYAAIDFIEDRLRKHHIGVCGKEKYGTYRDEFLTFWDGGLYQILFGYRACIHTFHTYQFYFRRGTDITTRRNKWKFWYNQKIGKKLHDFADKVHHFIYSKIDYAIPTIPRDVPFEDYHIYYDKRKWLGLVWISEKIGLTKLVHKYQAYQYNKTFQLACKRWPHLVEELICMTNGYEMIKPCRWGNIDGKEIFSKHWYPA